jgi:hypothetical protein
MVTMDNAPRVQVFRSILGCRPDWRRADIAAGRAIAAVALPIAVACAAIAGLPARLGPAELHVKAKGLLDRARVPGRVGAGIVFEDLDDACSALRVQAPPEQAAGPLPAPATHQKGKG